MKHEFLSVLRRPDRVTGATDESPFRFEETPDGCPVQYEYRVEENCAKVIVYPSGAPVKFLKLRFHGDLSFVESVFGDQWERSYNPEAPLEWRSVMMNRRLPWFCYLRGEGRMMCYGVKVQPDCFAYWQADTRGITLFLNLTSGSRGVDLTEPLVACQVVERLGEEGETPFESARAFAAKMCEHPVLPREPIFGVNNWYWAYGRITHDSVMTETDYLLEMTDGCSHRPYMILDDGWQLNRTFNGDNYIGGPWIPSDRFGDMAKTADDIHKKGAKAGIWFRPLLTLGEIPDEARLGPFKNGGQLLDPSHPFTLERVRRDAALLRSWGFELLKHDFTTYDSLDMGALSAEKHGVDMFRKNWKMYDRTKTTATVLKNLYRAIQDGAGEADVIGCNVIGHLAAGIHSAYRVGGDTSGRSWEISVRNGVNSMMRLPLNDTFYRADPDCAAFTERVDADANLDFLEMCAITGVTTLASVTPGILTAEQMERIRRIYRIADRDEKRLGIVNFEKTATPETFSDGEETRTFDWSRIYDGSRSQLSWME